MNTAVINIKIEPVVKREAQKIAEELGFSLSSLINSYLRQIIRTKTIFVSTVKEEPSEYLLESLKESKKDIEKGRVSPHFDNAKGAKAWLDNPKRKYAYQIHKKI